MNYTYRFPAVKGVQAGTDYYICMIPCKYLCKLFPVNTDSVLPEFRAQRKLNENRIPEIKSYILENRDSYVFSALAASIDGDFSFEENTHSVGILNIDFSSSFLINDGQHRNAAIQEAIIEDPTIGDETIPIVFFEDKGLKRSQQMFTDLNKYAVKPTKSQNTFYDHKDALALLSKKVIESIEFFKNYTDVENDTLGKFSAKLFTLNSFYTANQNIVGSDINEEKEDFAVKFWEKVVDSIYEWKLLQQKLIVKKALREDYIITQNIVLYALGKIGGFIFNNKIIDWEVNIERLSNINWLRTNPEWQGIAIEDGKISKKSSNVSLTYIKIKQLIGLELTEKEINMLEV